MGTEQSLNALIEAETANLVFLIHMHCSNKVEYAIHDSNHDQILTEANIQISQRRIH